MSNVDIKVTSGQLDVSKEKNLLIWFLGKFIPDMSVYIQTAWMITKSPPPGQKFPRSREVTLEGTINFSGHPPGPSDPMCTDLTAYIKVGVISVYQSKQFWAEGWLWDDYRASLSLSHPLVFLLFFSFTSEYLIWLYLDAAWTSTPYKCIPQQSHVLSQVSVLLSCARMKCKERLK